MTTWVLLRGLMRESRHWGDFPAQFKQALHASAVVTLDFPGNGSLHQQTSATHVAEMVRHARKHLQGAGFPPPYHVLALSLGAMVAVAWSEMHPDELEKLVLINTSLAPYNPFYHRLRPQNYLVLSCLLFSSAPRREALILKLTSSRSDTRIRSAILERWIDYAQEYPVSRANMLRQLTAATRYRAASHAPAVPVLLLASLQDQLVSVKCSLALARQWGCMVKLHPTAGHDLPLDAAAWVIQQTSEFVTY